MVWDMAGEHSYVGVLGDNRGCNPGWHDCRTLVLVYCTVCHPFPSKLPLTLAEHKLPLLRLCMETACFSDDFLDHDEFDVLQFGTPPEMLENLQHSVCR